MEDEGDEPASAEQPALRLADEPEDAPEAPTPSERANTGLRLARKSAAAAGIAKSNDLKTGFTALVVAVAGFIVPYTFVYNPYLLLQGDIFHILLGCATAFMGIVGLSAAVQGFLIDDLNIVERLLLFSIPFLVLYPSLIPNVVGACFLAAIWFKQKTLLKRRAMLA